MKKQSPKKKTHSRPASQAAPQKGQTTKEEHDTTQQGTAQPHDLFFKDTTTAVQGCLLVIMQLALSKLEYSWFEWSKVNFKKEVFRDAFGREVRADVVCEVPLKPHIQRRLATLLQKKIKNFRFIFLLEHKAQNAMLVCKQLLQVWLYPTRHKAIFLDLKAVGQGFST